MTDDRPLLLVFHRCLDRLCVRPSHLFIGSKAPPTVRLSEPCLWFDRPDPLGPIGALQLATAKAEGDQR